MKPPVHQLTQLVGLMAAVDSAVGMNLEVEADANPTVEPASPASRTDPLLQKLALQRDEPCSGRGANQLSEGQKVERNIHSSRSGTRGDFARPPLLAFWCRSCGLGTRNRAHTRGVPALLGITPAAVAGAVLLARGYL